MTDQIGSGTAQGVIDYLDSLVEKGRSRPGVIMPLKTAITKVLEVTEGDESWGAVDVTALDVDDVMSRFKNKTLSKYTPASYVAYQSRMTRAIGWYKNFLTNPGWAPPQNGTVRTSASNSDSAKKTAKTFPSDKSLESNPGAVVSDSRPNPIREIDAIPYPFPLENGKLARFYVPNGMTKADVERVAGFLNALVIEKSSED